MDVSFDMLEDVAALDVLLAEMSGERMQLLVEVFLHLGVRTDGVKMTHLRLNSAPHLTAHLLRISHTSLTHLHTHDDSQSQQRCAGDA